MNCAACLHPAEDHLGAAAVKMSDPRTCNHAGCTCMSVREVVDATINVASGTDLDHVGNAHAMQRYAGETDSSFRGRVKELIGGKAPGRDLETWVGKQAVVKLGPWLERFAAYGQASRLVRVQSVADAKVGLMTCRHYPADSVDEEPIRIPVTWGVQDLRTLAAGVDIGEDGDPPWHVEAWPAKAKRKPFEGADATFRFGRRKSQD